MGAFVALAPKVPGVVPYPNAVVPPLEPNMLVWAGAVVPVFIPNVGAELALAGLASVAVWTNPPKLELPNGGFAAPKMPPAG